MSYTKRYLENLTTLAADAIEKECKPLDNYWLKNREYNTIWDDVFEDITSNDADNVFDTIFEYAGNFDNDLIEEFPISFSAICALYPYLTERTIRDWTEVIKITDQLDLYKALNNAYDETYCMGDPSLDEAKEWHRKELNQHNYTDLISAIECMITDYELDIAEYPETQKALAMLKNAMSE